MMLVKIFSFCVFTLLFVSRTDGGLTASLRASTGEVSDNELADFSELVLSKDVPNEYGEVSLTLQNRYYRGQPSGQHLMDYKTIQGRREPSTYPLLRQLFQAYESNRNINGPKNAFLDEVLNSDVMEETINFLKYHGLRMNKATLKNYLDTIWFTSYHRGQGLWSSGFQHVFMAEIKNNEVKGLHNWIFYLDQQSKNQLSYVGYNKYFSFKGYPSGIIKFRYQWKGVEKPSGSMFVSTSPELEMALYTVCFILRPDKDCNLKLGTVNVNIKTHKFDIRKSGEQVIGSAYPMV